MYGVIMAGGGGTRLHPLSRPERPKPFLPLLGPASLLQATAARLRPLTDDITVVTDRRYESPGPRAAPRGGRADSSPSDATRRPRSRSPTLAIDRPPDEVMIVLPADQTIEREDRFRDVLRRGGRPPRHGRVRHRRPARDAGVRADRPATEYGYLLPARRARRGDRRAVAPIPLRAFEEKPNPARAEQLQREAGIAWNAGMFLWRRRAIRVRARAVHRPRPDARADGGLARRCSSAPTNRSRRRCPSTMP